MKFKLIRYYFVFIILTLGLFFIENSQLTNKMGGESGPVVEEIQRRPIEPNYKEKEKEQVDTTKKIRPVISFRSNQLC